MSDIIVGEYIGPSIRPVLDMDYVGQPTIGYVIRTDKGWYAITARDECKHVGSFGDAVRYVEGKWNTRK